LLWVCGHYISHPIGSLLGVHLIRVHTITIWHSRRRDQVRLWSIDVRGCLVILLLLISIRITSIKLILILFDLIGQLVCFQVIHLSTHGVVVAVACLWNLVELL
jgi:hypothetical protein